MLNKIITILTVLLFSSNVCFAQTTTTTNTSTNTVGQFSILKQGDRAKFDGILLDPLAMATILADKEQSKDFFDLKLKHDLEVQKNDSDLEIEKLKLSLKFKDKEFEQISKIKEEELAFMRDKALNKNDYTWLYIGGGVVGGILITLGVLFAVKKIQE